MAKPEHANAAWLGHSAGAAWYFMPATAESSAGIHALVSGSSPRAAHAAMPFVICASASLASVAKTLGAGIGLTDAQLNDQITAGTAIRSALA